MCRRRQCINGVGPDDWILCPECTEKYPDGVAHYEQLFLEETRAELRDHAARAVAQLPEWHRNKTLDELHECLSPALVPFAERFVLGSRSAEVSGLSGDGKTAAMAAIVKRHAEMTTGDFDIEPAPVWALRGFMWTRAHDLIRARKEHSLGEGEAPLIDRAKYSHVLVIDEMTSEPASEIPFEIVDERYAAGKTTVVTTGLRPAEFQRRYGQAMHRRLTEKGVGTLVSSFRREKS